MLEGFRSRRAACDIDIHRYKLIQTLDDAINVVHSAAVAARAHGDDPFGFGHLFVESQDDGSDLLEDRSSDDHEIGLPGRAPEDLGSKACQIEPGSENGRHLDEAA